MEIVLKPKPKEQALFGKPLKVLPVKHDVRLFGHYRNVLDKHFLLVKSKNVFELASKLCLSSNVCRGGQTAKFCLTSKIQNVCQAMLKSLPEVPTSKHCLANSSSLPVKHNVFQFGHHSA